MRSVIRPALVGFAVVGLSLAGAASAQACDKHDKPASSVNVANVENDIEDSFNDFNNNTLIAPTFFGDVTTN